jgi:hypothetical protein
MTKLRRLEPTEAAQVDQMLATLREVERAWPHNAHFMDDDSLSTLIRERIEEPWQTVSPDRADVLWADGRRTELEPHPDVIRAVVEATLPNPSGDCDRCYALGVSGVALVAAPPHLVALALCGPCISFIDPDELFLIGDQT